MNANTLLISYKTLIEKTSLTENNNPGLFLPLIKDVQERKIKPVIGTALFEKLKSDIVANTLSDDYKTLIDDYIHPALIDYIFSELPYKSNFRFSNVGMGTRQSEDQKQTEEKTIRVVSDYYKSNGVFRAGELTDYLRANVELYPEYKEFITCKDAPHAAQYDIGIYLG